MKLVTVAIGVGVFLFGLLLLCWSVRYVAVGDAMLASVHHEPPPVGIRLGRAASGLIIGAGLCVAGGLLVRQETRGRSPQRGG